MVTLYTDARMLDHHPPKYHPERPERLQAIFVISIALASATSARVGWFARPRSASCCACTRRRISESVARLELKGGGPLDADTWVYPGTNEAAKLAAGAAVVEAVAQSCAGPDPRALCLVRPPGHHARPHTAMGFCVYGNVAVAAADALATHGLSRVLVVDFDVHHGNGTQEIFYEHGRVGFLSIHRYPFYPGTGALDETGSRQGLGLIRNVPIAFGTARPEYHAAFRSALETLAAKVKPELILIGAGFDAHAEDPVGSLGSKSKTSRRLPARSLTLRRFTRAAESSACSKVDTTCRSSPAASPRTWKRFWKRVNAFS